MNRPDGRYTGSIVSAYVAEDQWEKGQYVLKLDVNLEDGGAVSCRQSLAGDDREKKQKRDAVLQELGLAWPFQAAALRELAGRSIDVNLKTSAKGRQNAYVATAMPERVLTDAEIDALADDNLPF